MAGSNVIRGSRVGAGPMGEAERGDTAPRVVISYWCSRGHEVALSFAADEAVDVPETWVCPKCGRPSGQDRSAPPDPAPAEPFKTHLAYVKERRTDADGEALLEEALSALRRRTGGR